MHRIVQLSNTIKEVDLYSGLWLTQKLITVQNINYKYQWSTQPQIYIYSFPYLRFRDYYGSGGINITRAEGQKGPV